MIGRVIFDRRLTLADWRMDPSQYTQRELDEMKKSLCVPCKVVCVDGKSHVRLHSENGKGFRVHTVDVCTCLSYNKEHWDGKTGAYEIPEADLPTVENIHRRHCTP